MIQSYSSSHSILEDYDNNINDQFNGNENGVNTTIVTIGNVYI